MVLRMGLMVAMSKVLLIPLQPQTHMIMVLLMPQKEGTIKKLVSRRHTITM